MKKIIIYFVAGVAILFSLSCSKTSTINVDIDPWSIENEKPIVVHAGLVDTHILGITIKEGMLVRSSWGEYTAEEGDSVAIGRTRRGEVSKRILYRGGKAVGYLAGANMTHLSTFEKVIGDTLNTSLLEETSTYILRGKGKKDVHPPRVHRKSKILTKSNATDQLSMVHTVYLELPPEIARESSITIQFAGLHLQDSVLKIYTHPSSSRSEAIHVTQAGFRPDDPVKRAYLSVWKGTGGGHEYDRTPLFSVVDPMSGKTVYNGSGVKAIAIDGTESLKDVKNYSKTEVWFLDFSALANEGNYVIEVEGVGRSFPFEVSRDAWGKGFDVTMLGFLSHRSGIEITPELVPGYSRPRCFYPGDGVKIHESRFSLIDLWADHGGDQDGAFMGLVKNKTPKTREDAWGGYMDAGDWDRRIQHLNATRQLLELFLMFPSHYEQKVLAVLPGEKNNGIPDILDEVAWNVDCYGRMQSSDGGISMGIESAEHPVEGEPSWLESLDIFRFDEDPKSSLLYAGVAAQLSRALEIYNQERAKWYGESAKKAFAHGLKFNQFPRVKELPEHRLQSIKDEAALAAIELYKLTGEADYYKVFENYARSGPSHDNQSPSFAVLDAAFSLATAKLDEMVSEAKRKAAELFILDHAEKMVDMVHRNVYGITNRIPDVPIINGYYSGANNQEICRAYFLTGDKKYLEAAVLSVMYSSGANPMNMSLTKGLGHRYPRRPLHLDSEFTGQWAPDGITVYAQADHEYYRAVLDEKELGGAWGTWATYWYSGKVNVPSGWDWPPHEAYIDYSRFPGMNEYTVHQTFGPASYAYGFLDARGQVE